MNDKNGFEISTRDRVLRAWENSVELVRDFQLYADEADDKKISEYFYEFAEDEGKHASKLREVLKSYENK